MKLSQKQSQWHRRRFALVTWLVVCLFLVAVFGPRELVGRLAPEGKVRAQDIVVPPLNLLPLNQSAVPEPPNLYQYVTNKSVAIQLGKAFFWDMQVGSDGVTACATCHFSAGADNRVKNTVNPGANAGDVTFQVTGGPNGVLQPSDFPFHQRAEPDDLQSSPVIRNVNDVVGSQGVRRADFVDIVRGSAVDNMVPVPDPVFNVGGVNVRQVTGRNTPTVINAVFDFTSFRDGRAGFIFNGENPFGPADAKAGVWFNDPVQGLVKRPVRLLFANLASQATGPPLNDVEMSARGRTFPQLGRKLLSLVPLGKQVVSHDDSVLGGLARSRLRADGTVQWETGLHTSYEELIRESFHDNLWDSGQMATITLSNGQPAQFTQMEANFAFFWGVSVQLYMATLVSDQTAFDHWLGGDDTALTDQQKTGFALFSGIGNCTACHEGIELTNASKEASGYLSDDVHALIEMMFVADGSQVIYDNGYNNTAVTPTTDDIGRGATAPFINSLTGQPFPLSFSERAELEVQNLLPISTPILNPGVPENMPVNANGAFKVPGLRNVALTTPYFHNGGEARLEEVVDFYVRGGNFPNDNIHDLDPVIHAGIPFLQGKEDLHQALVAFMESLTDWRVAAEVAPFDHPELLVPAGDPEVFVRIPAVDSNGTPVPGMGVTLNPVTSPTNVNSQTLTGTVQAGLTPVVTVTAPTTAGLVTVTGTNWTAQVSGLVPGANVVTVSVTEPSGVVTTVTDTIVLDILPPGVTLNAVNTPTTVNSQIVSGTVEAGALVRISLNGGASAPAVVTGTTWTHTVNLNPGPNNVLVSAYDAAGNTTTLPPATIVLQPGTSVFPSLLLPMRGLFVNRTLANLANDDAAYVSVRSLNSAGMDTADWSVQFSMPAGPAPTSLKLEYDGNQSAAVFQVLSIMNWRTRAWQPVDSRIAQAGTDQAITWSTATPADFMSGPTRMVRVRVTGIAMGVRFTNSADVLRLVITR